MVRFRPEAPLSQRSLSLATGCCEPALAAGAEGDAYEPSGEPAPSLYAKAVDLTLVRPLGLVPIVVSGVGCAMGLPVAWFFQSPVDVDRICWRDPVDYTFTRPLGEF